MKFPISLVTILTLAFNSKILDSNDYLVLFLTIHVAKFHWLHGFLPLPFADSCLLPYLFLSASISSCSLPSTHFRNSSVDALSTSHLSWRLKLHLVHVVETLIEISLTRHLSNLTRKACINHFEISFVFEVYISPIS